MFVDLFSILYFLFLIFVFIRAAVHPEEVEAGLPNEGEDLEGPVRKKNQNERLY